ACAVADDRIADDARRGILNHDAAAVEAVQAVAHGEAAEHRAPRLARRKRHDRAEAPAVDDGQPWALLARDRDGLPVELDVLDVRAGWDQHGIAAGRGV